MSTLKCFIVEDSPMIRDNLVATLEEMLPLRVVGTAEDEAGAVAWLKGGDDGSGDCDVVIIDIFLKAGSGLGVLRAAQADRQRRNLVVLSNYATADMRQRCKELGADRFFDKSNELEKLIDYCDELCRQASS